MNPILETAPHGIAPNLQQHCDRCNRDFFCPKGAFGTHRKFCGRKEELFWAKVKKMDSCWLWTACLDVRGYGQFSFNRRRISAHRYSYQLAHGKIADDLCVLHKCDVPHCVNPDHLFLGTRADNTADMEAKGRAKYENRTKLTPDQVREIRAAPRGPNGHLVDGPGLSKKYNVCMGSIHRIVYRGAFKNIKS